jgi:hypothetical protein
MYQTPHRLGKDGSGAPALLIQAHNASGRTPGPIVLQHITVKYDSQCRLTSHHNSAAMRESRFSIVRCTSGEPALRESFVRVAEIATRRLGATPSPADIGRVVRGFTELFRAFELPARRAVHGLWAELVTITLASSPENLLTAWHEVPDEGFDFSCGPSRVEVKSFSGEGRIHHFSLRQARPGPGIDALIASIRAERSAGGISISDLMRQLAQRALPDNLLEKAERLVAESLGDSAGTGLSLTFDLERARESLRFFDARSVPAIEPPLPTGIVSVRFESLLDETTAIAAAEVRYRGGLANAVCPPV